MTPKDRNSAIAAALILIGFAALLMLMPTLVLWIGAVSPLLAALVGALIILSFFAVFWLRARYQRRHKDEM
ncbi:hypothetical protein NAC44_00505 [Allorhizobium sp. BGMRC 0089]|uniref:hypothetical protein n=1 Tax=Allorhizobium sonneratiae TaxID=2934936 RepID=UPI0020335F65|nr:hypothetical protein [Allorhizobium sonneratiae]MCM2290807.1 hypothetical protein [Allorhizobium sonneratiae]